MSFAIIAMMLMGAVGINKASATSFNLPFFDDLNYSSISAMVSAGWTQCGSAPQSYYSVGNSLLTLENDGSVASLMCWSNIPAGVTSWTVTLRIQYTQQLPAGGWTGGGSWLSLTTASHSYGWDLDGYYGSYYLFRDGVKVSAVGGYTPQLGAWHTLTLDMRHGLLSASADGNVITSYTEASGTNNALTMVETQPGWETVNTFDYASISFRDDFDYSSISAMVSAGWTQCGSAPQSYYSVGNSLLTLENDGSVASQMCWSNIPAGVTSWTVSLSGQYAQQLPAGGWTGGGTWLSLTTPAHSYGWDLDGYYKSYYLFRDGVKVSAIGGYTPQLGAWHTLTLDMNNGVLSAIADGNVITTYAEAGGTNNALTMVEAQPGWETVNNFDYASITFRGSPNFDFSISSSPTSANVVKGDTVISTISVSLTLGSAPTATLSQSGCPPSATCSFNPSSGTPSYTSVLTVATTGSTPMGTYTITVSGTAGALTRTTTFSVTVTPSLGDLWSYTGSGAAYFERQSYSIDSSVVEVAPFQYDSNTIYMYYRTQVNDVCILGVCQQGSIGLARSFDGGLTFSLYNGGAPVVSAGSIGSCDWDSLYVVAPSVVKVNGVYYMVYEGQRYDSCIPSYGSTGDIGLATSSDGLTWQKRGIVLYHGLGFESANIGTPSVEYFNGQFYVFYHGFDGTQSHIGYAYGSSQCTPAGSTNCTLSLQKYCCNPVMDIGKGIGAWDSAVNSRASIIWDAASGYYYMSYEGSQSIGGGCGGGNWGWGIARSTNLNSWEKYLFNPIRQTYKGGCGNDIPYIFKFNGQIYVYQREYGQRNILTSGSDKYLTVYLAVNNGQGQCELWSHEGRKDGDGWAANTAQDSQGHMCYGPYVTSLPNGKYWVNFREMIDNNNADASWVINEEIYDDTTPSSVVLHHVSRTDFVNTYTYQNFYLQFPDTSPHSYEFRTWYYAIAYIRQYMVSVRQIG